MLAKKRAWRRSKGRGEREYLWRRQGINCSFERFKELETAQGGACAICRAVPQSLCVDHCHKTGAVRGLLCAHCNRALGFLRDNPESCARAVEYLNKGS